MAVSSNPSDLPFVDTKQKVLGLIGIQARFSSLELQYKNEIDALDRKVKFLSQRTSINGTASDRK